MKEALERVIEAIAYPGRPHQRDRAAQDPDQGRRLALPVRADEAAPDGLPGRRRGLDVATRRRTTTRRPTPRPSRARQKSPLDTLAARLTPDIVRSIIGLTLLVLGAMTLIALTLPSEGALTELVDRRLRAVVRDDALGRAVPAAARRLVARMGPRHAAGLGLGDHPRRPVHHLRGHRRAPPRSSASPVAGSDGLWRRILTDLFSAPGAFVLLIALAVLGVIVGFGIPLRQLARPAVGTARWMGTTAAASLKRTPAEEAEDTKAAAAAEATATKNGGRRQGRRRAGAVAGPDRRLGRRHRHPRRRPERRPELGDVRAATGGRRRAPRRRSFARSATSTTSPTARIRHRPRTASTTPCRRSRSSTTSPSRSTPVATRRHICWSRTSSSRSSPASASRSGSSVATPARSSPSTRSSRRRTSSSAGSRPCRTTCRWPSPRARFGSRRRSRASSAVGIEIPNKDFNVVALRRILEELDFKASGSTLTFALGPRRGGQGPGGRPGQDAAPAHRRRDRLGQERHGQRADHEPAVRGDAGRRPDDPDGPQAGRAGRLQRPAPPARAGHHRARAGQGRAQVGGQRDGGPLPAARRRDRPQHPRLQRDPGRPRRQDAVHRHRHRRARRPDDARGQERRGSDRPARPEGARDRHPHGPRHAAAVGQRRDRA